MIPLDETDFIGVNAGYTPPVMDWTMGTTLYNHVLVLEDTQERVDWLRRTFPTLDVHHCTTVVDFLKANRRPCALVILDHDLGGELGYSPEADAIYKRGEASDAHGLTGMDAVRVCDRLTPAVVWSVNPVWGPRMRNALEEHRVPVVYYPFRSDERMASVIREAYFVSTGQWLPVSV